MYKDKAIDEIRERRKKLFKEKYNNSIEKFINDAKKWQQKNPQKVVNLRKVRLLKKAS